MNGNRIAAMKRQQKEARRLMATGVIVWDEISVAPKCAQEAVESLPREVVQNYRSFGGKLFIIGDDFRQVLQTYNTMTLSACVRQILFCGHCLTFAGFMLT
ncbi:hypothetical protein NECAME_08792 [Necator americanus]|uniref:ATP-dependent DNA helicase n=1 Tax=Necator americanus TaxID=51031 RepID=W2TGS1_NECAM|nr:hypothetical protein NECAME_08792 [Necator americanus]ETN81038.1 hypothetical protein NECAME_08792 [Necator americanus]